MFVSLEEAALVKWVQTSAKDRVLGQRLHLPEGIKTPLIKTPLIELGEGKFLCYWQESKLYSFSEGHFGSRD